MRFEIIILIFKFLLISLNIQIKGSLLLLNLKTTKTFKNTSF